MKVQHDTGWYSLINKALRKKPVDKLEGANQELSENSSVSTLTNIWPTNRLWQRKNRLQKPHRRYYRLPPSLLSSKAADLWNTLMPLRANCSCSSVSVGVKCSRSSFGASFSGVTVTSSQSSVPSLRDTVVPQSLGNTLEHAHLAFELLIARMLRLVNILNAGSSSSSHLFSGSDLKVSTALNPDSKRSAEFIVGDSCCGLSTVTCLSTNSNDHSQERWLGDRTGRKSQSSSKFEIAEQREKYLSSVKNFFPSKLFTPKALRESICILTKEELTYLLQNKKSILSEYFQRKTESTNLKNSLESKREILICATQSDSRLQHRGTLEFVQFIRTRKKEDSKKVGKVDIHSSAETLESKTDLQPFKKEISDHLLIPKRRVTFSDPVVENTTTLSNCCLFKNEDEISSARRFVTANTHGTDNSWFGFVNSKFALPSNSSVTLKTCTAIFSLGDLDLENTVHEEEPEVIEFDVTQSELMTEKVSKEEVEIVSVTPEDDFGEPMISVLTNTLTFGNSTKEAGEMIGKKRPKRLKFLVRETLDFGTTHVPTLDEEELTYDARDAELDQCCKQQDVERHLQRNRWQVLIPETFDSMRSKDFNLNPETEDHLVRKKVAKLKTNQKSKIPIKTPQQSSTFSCFGERQISKIESNDHLPSLPGKMVTFQDVCQTLSDRSIISDHAELELSVPPGDELFPLSDTTGRFELAWKGCWEQRSTTDLEQSNDQVRISFDEEESNFPELNPVHNQNSYYTMTENQIQLVNDCGVGNINEGFEFRSSPNSTRCTAAPTCQDNSQTIPWITNPNEYLSEPCKLGSKFNYTGFDPSPEEINLRNFTDLKKGLGNLSKGIRYPEIWRTDVPALSQRNWYTACDCNNSLRKKPKIQNDSLMRKLNELYSSPDADYDSDYYMESEVESDFKLTRNLSRIKGSFTNINADFENRTRFKMRKNRFGGNLFLDKVWSTKNIFVKGCRCHKNAWSPRHDLQLRERDLRHRSLGDSDQRSSQNFCSHLRAHLIVDSETDDSDLAPSIQSDYTYNYKRKCEHVNKIKCRRFVKSLKSSVSNFQVTPETADRLDSSTEVLNVAFERSFSPAGVQTVLSTRSIGTTVSAKQNSCSMMDVCTDTNDLSSNESIGTITLVSDLFLSNNDSGCQTLESFLVALKLLQSTDRVSRTAEVLEIKTDMESGSSVKINDNGQQNISNVMASLSAEISDASNNLAKLRFAEINTVNKRDNLNDAQYVSCPQKILQQSANVSETRKSFKSGATMLSFHDKPTNCKKETVENFEEKQSNIPIDFNSNCPICSSHKKSTTRYAVPTCIVMGTGPDPKENEKDPWNRVMERAKVQRRFEGWNASTFSEMKASLTTPASSPKAYLKSFQNKQSSTSIDRATEAKESAAEMRSVQCKNNSSQSTCALQNSAAIYNKTPSFPIQNETPHGTMFSSAALCSSKFMDFPTLNIPRSRSSRRTRKSLATSNKSNRLLYIISEKAEMMHQMPIKVPAANFFT